MVASKKNFVLINSKMMTNYDENDDNVFYLFLQSKKFQPKSE